MKPPLSGIRVIELAGIGPGPFAAMMLADHGAEVIRVERKGAGAGPESDPARDVLLRSRKVLMLDLKSDQGRAVLLDLIRSADALIEGYRPGVLERLGLGPDVLLAENPRLVIGRVTGWGQTGPLAPRAGHDINYAALTGALHAIGRAGDKPVIPLNLVADFGGGAMFLAFGMLAALIRAREDGQGQVVDAAMADGAAVLLSMFHSFLAMGFWQDQRGVNLLDGGAPFYDTYETADGGHVAIGAIEPQFYTHLLELLGLSGDADFADQMDPARWPMMRERLTTLFLTRSRAEWEALLSEHDSCFAPVLSLTEAPDHPHNRARGTFVTAGGVVQAAPAPRYSESPTVPPRMRGAPSDAGAVLAALGYNPRRIAELTGSGAVG